MIKPTPLKWKAMVLPIFHLHLDYILSSSSDEDDGRYNALQ